jgi:type IV secretory pathway VirB9-like protein
MKLTVSRFSLSLLCCGSLFAADAIPSAPTTVPPSTETKKAKPKRESPDESKLEPPSVPIDPASAARAVQYGERDVVPIRTRVRFTTLIVLPKNEQIMDFVCGDKEYWIVNGAQNFAYVKPAKPGGRTNLNLVTANGNVYSFVLNEISDAPPDLKVFVELRDEGMISALNGPPKFVPAQQLEDFRQQAEIARTQAREARQTAQAAIASEVSSFRNNYPAKMKFAYRFDREKRPFLVSAIFHDDKFTYIQANPEEPPTLYEVKDGQPNLINFQFKSGTYVVDKILDNGYLMIGKQRLPFVHQE